MIPHFETVFDSVDAIKELRKSILQLAVKGKLVDQNPKDEPASVLLEKVKKEKVRLVEEGKIKKPKALPKIEVEEIPFDAPEGWTWCRLENLTELTLLIPEYPLIPIGLGNLKKLKKAIRIIALLNNLFN